MAIAVAQGDGPVHALDKALRKVLEDFYPLLGIVHLTDYKVRVLDSKDASAAKVRVLIETTDGENSWSTVGVSTDIIEASWMALVDSIEYKLMKEGVVPPASHEQGEK
jgi:2-isopropylmalate synthase